MSSFLRQSTAGQSRSIGPFIDDTDGKTAETGLTIANTDIKLMFEGGASANKNSGGGTHRVNGMYGITFDATDTASVGEIAVSVIFAGALPVWAKFVVLEEAVYDALFAVSAAGPLTSLGANAPANWINAAAIAADAITDAKVASDVTIASVTGAVGSVVGSVGSVTGNVGGSVGSVIGSVGSVTAGVVVTTNNDKTGYSLSQAFPSNFASLGINSSGHVSRVVLVDTTTTNSDMRGTDSALLASSYTAPPTTTQISTKIADDWFTGANSWETGLEMLRDGYIHPLLPNNFVSLGINVSGHVSRVVLVDTTTTNTDMRGTDSALLASSYTAPPTTTQISNKISDDITNSENNWESARSELAHSVWQYEFTQGNTAWSYLIRLTSGVADLFANLATMIENATGWRFKAKALEQAPSGTGASAAAIREEIDNNSTKLASILADTNELQTDWASGGRLDSIVMGTAGTVVSINAVVDSILVDTGTTLDGKINTIDGIVDSIKAKTDQFVFTVANQVDANALSGGGSGLDAAGVRAAVGLASANLDTQLGDIPTNAEFNARSLPSGDYFVVADYTAPPTAAANADAVWDELLTDHAIVGSTGAALAAAGGSGDPWATVLPGAYAAGTAGAIIGGGGGGGSIDTEQLLADLLAGLGSVDITRVGARFDPVTRKITLRAGDDYSIAGLNALSFGVTLPGIDLSTVTVVYWAQDDFERTIPGTATLTNIVGSSATLVLEWARADTNKKPSDRYVWGVAFIIAGEVQTILGGALVLEPPLVPAAAITAAL